ncbi:MAG: DNA repair protein RecO [Pelagibacteraceae bacterium TMED201]|nr:DNA repair protein RecO [Pelagibacterales bacterium SAG-MED30]OUW63672.1 MAG: DNA repair protein RecO [Pelagibacteraceae bacterium TMED201]|tara:strand:+ start:358 stop:1038 length:681 start_codon:yes stop_codon:yes gene_type:complete
MIWDDIGFLLSKNRYNENSLITEIYTKDHGKISGIIFGGTSKKIKNYLQTGNQLYLNYNSKSDNRIGYFKIEIYKAYSPIYFDNPQKLNCITSSMNLIKLLTADSQVNIKIYNIIDKFYSIIPEDNWIQKYIYWELELLKTLGYDLELSSKVNKQIIDNKTFYVAESSTEKKIVPNFLIDKTETVTDLKTLLAGLKLVGDYLEKTILKPNNINFPISRLQFISSLK